MYASLNTVKLLKNERNNGCTGKGTHFENPDRKKIQQDEDYSSINPIFFLFEYCYLNKIS